MKNKMVFLNVFGISLLMIMVACGPNPNGTSEPGSPTDDVIGMANPSAVYCEGLGFTTENVERNGGMDSDCVFPDGSRCPAWDFLAGRCGQQYSYCSTQGYSIESSDDSNIGACLFPDGSSCGEYDYFTGVCLPTVENPAP